MWGPGALIEVLIEAGRDPRRRRPARAGRAGRPAGRVLPPAGQENKKRISFYRTRTTKRRSHHPTARVAPLPSPPPPSGGRPCG